MLKEKEKSKCTSLTKANKNGYFKTCLYVKSQPKTIIGFNPKKSMTENKTGELWKRFVPNPKGIKAKMST